MTLTRVQYVIVNDENQIKNSSKSTETDMNRQNKKIRVMIDNLVNDTHMFDIWIGNS